MTGATTQSNSLIATACIQAASPHARVTESDTEAPRVSNFLTLNGVHLLGTARHPDRRAYNAGVT